jgi:hypothetical protein
MSIKLRIASITFFGLPIWYGSGIALVSLKKMDFSESYSAVVINAYYVDLGI